MLGVGPDASAYEIRRAFASAVRAAHPDAGNPEAGASDRLAELIRARDLALNPPAPPTPAPPPEIDPRRSGFERLLGLAITHLARATRSRSGRHLR